MRVPTAVLLLLLAAPGASNASPKPLLTPERVTRLPSPEPGTVVLTPACAVGATGAGAFLVDDLQPPNDHYFVRARPATCTGCASAPGVWVSAVNLQLEFRVPCSQPVEVAIVGPVVDTVCSQPDQSHLFRASTTQLLTAGTTGMHTFSVPLGGPVPLLKDSYLRVTFTADGAGCSAPGTRPRLVTTSSCSLCVAWNYYPADTTDLCQIFFPGDPRIWAQVDSCISPELLGVGDRAGVATQLRMVPNPARNGGDIQFTLASERDVRITLHDVAGRRVRRLLDEVRPAGTHTVRWDGRDDGGTVVRPGTYFVTVRTNGDQISKRVVFAR
jgi:hypothetical protein